MQEFLVLGLIPGTNIQITFGTWLLVVYVITALAGAFIIHRKHLVSNLLVTLLLIQQTRHMRA